MFNNLRGGFEWNIGFMTYGDRWKRHRKWFQQSFQSKQRLESYVPIQQRERARLLTDLLRQPVAYAAHVKRKAESGFYSWPSLADAS